MALVAEKGVISAKTTTGNQAYSLGAGFAGVTPKVIFLWSNGTTSLDTLVTDCVFSYGVGTIDGGSVQQFYQGFFVDEIDPSVTAGGRNTDAILAVFLANSATPDCRADLVSLDSGGFTLNWSNAAASAYKIHYVAVGGADLAKARVGSYIESGASPQSVTIAAGWGQPDLLMFFNSRNAVGDAASTQQYLGWGVAKSDTVRQASHYTEVGAAATSQALWQQQRAALTISSVTVDSEIDLDVVANWPTDGFQIVKPDLPGGTPSNIYLALKGTFQSALGVNGALTAGSTQDNACGFPPKIGFVFGGNMTAIATIQTSGADLGAWGIGATDGTNEGSGWILADDALAANTGKRSYHSESKVYVRLKPSVTKDASADGSFSGNNFRLTFDDLAAAAGEYVWFALGDAPTAVEHFGATELQLGISTDAAATRETFSSAAVSLSVDLAAAGTVSTGPTEHFGAAELALNTNAATAGTRQTFASAELPATLTTATAGGRQTFATAELPLTITTAATGKLGAFGTATLTPVFDLAAAGTVQTGAQEHFGAVTLDLSIATSSAGTSTKFAAAALPLNLELAASGNITATHTGQAALILTVTIAAQGNIPADITAGSITITDTATTAIAVTDSGAAVTITDAAAASVTLADIPG